MYQPNSTIQSEIIKAFDEEVTNNEQGTVWITKNKGINMRTVWDKIRENYYGVFKNQKDRLDQYKIFYPMTEFMVWENVKNIDVDTKDINVKAKHPGAIGGAETLRYLVKDWMYRNNYGEEINDDLMYFVLDGHLIKKKIDYKDRDGNDAVKTVRVDIRNTFIDPNADSLHDSPFIERSVQNTAFIKQNHKDKWFNLDNIAGETDVPEIFNEQKSQVGTELESEIYERWAIAPESWIKEGGSEDKQVEAHFVASRSGDGKSWILHLAEENKKVRPYEEARFEKAPNRWAGRGIGEKVLWLQVYLNAIYNVRRINNYTMMNQLFQFKGGTGITPQKIRNLVAGGAIEVQNIGDIARIDTRNINFNESISEEQNAIQVAQRTTSTQEAASGEALPSSTPATTAVIQNQTVKSSHALRQERYGLFLSRMFKNQIVPSFRKVYSKDDVLRLSGETDEIDKIKKRASEFYAIKSVEGAVTEGGMMNEVPSIESEMERFEDIMEDMDDLYLAMKTPSDLAYDIEFFVTGESFDKNTLIQNLQQILFNYQSFSQDPNSKKVLREIYNILGLDSKRLLSGSTPQPQQQPQGEPALASGATPNESQLLTQANNQIANGQTV